MNPRQLTIESLKQGGKPDRVAAGPFTGYFAAEHAGIPLGNYVTNGRLIAEGQLRLQEDLGQDILITAADTYYIAEAFGLKVDMHQNALPTAKAPPFNDPGEMRHLRVPDPFADGRMPVYLEALECLRASVGDDLAIRGTGTGPFSLAAYLLGIDNFMLRLMDLESGESSDDDARNMRALLGLMTETTLRFVEAQADAGADILYVGDSLASLNMISPRLYRTWVQPYHRKIFTALKEKIGPKTQYTMIHMCGSNMEILEDMVQTGVDLIEVDSAMDLAEVSAFVRGRAAVIGNIDPVHVLKDGGPENVTRACRDAIGKGIAGGRFILGSGCFVCPGTALENLRAMVDCAHGWAR